MEVNSGASVFIFTLAIEVPSLFYFLISKSRKDADFHEDVKKKNKNRCC
jgi:hypothetical protein